LIPFKFEIDIALLCAIAYVPPTPNPKYHPFTSATLASAAWHKKNDMAAQIPFFTLSSPSFI